MRAHSLSSIASLTAVLLAAGCDTRHDGDDSPVLEQQVEVAASKLARNKTPSSTNVPTLAAGNRAFAFALYQQLAKKEPNENLVFSPYSISTALAMAYAGARGKTADEMKSSLRFTLDNGTLHEAFNAIDLALAARGQGKVGADGTPFRLNVHNALWAQRNYAVEQAFLDTLAVHYGAPLYLQDFETNPEGARGKINAWVEEKTEKLIPELLPAGSIRTDTSFVLTNTVYFNASWKTKFTKEATRPAPFKRRDGTEVQAQLMHEDLRIPYAQGGNYVAVALPYASEELSMIAVLPAAGAFDAVEAAIGDAWFEALRAKLAVKHVALGFPKLDYKAQASLGTQLRALGMNLPFSKEADFSGLTSGRVAIDDVIHEAVIKVTEGGTIAAAATAVTIRTTSLPVFDATVTFDRPFLYAIVDQPTGQILFIGRVVDPTGA
jgi:serpin B